MPSPFKRLLGWAGVNKQWKMANTELLLTSSGIIPQSQEAYNEMMSKHPQHQPPGPDSTPSSLPTSFPSHRR